MRHWHTQNKTNMKTETFCPNLQFVKQGMEMPTHILALCFINKKNDYDLAHQLKKLQIEYLTFMNYPED